MTMSFLVAAVVVLGFIAVFDLIVGVSNDAVNFLNSSLGSRAAPRRVIIAIAAAGILVGVTFSGGMMEVARKGIFHPELFHLPELIVIYLAVMLTDIVLLDLFNTFGLPTSTTVSIVFELIGSAVAVSLLQLHSRGLSFTELGRYINTGRALLIISGILISVIIAFISGSIVQFFSRLLFTFDYKKRMRHFGALWGGAALSIISYFILVKGAKHASFLTPSSVEWIRTNTWPLLGYIFAVSAVMMQVLLFFKTNILKIIVLTGTFALAVAFAANDLVNFIGVPIAGFHAFKLGLASGNPFTTSMAGLSDKVSVNTFLLLTAGTIMAVTLWFSRKARTVSQTELGLSRQDEGVERFESTFLSRVIVRIVINFFEMVKTIIPKRVNKWFVSRLDPIVYRNDMKEGKRPSYDLIRASVNLMVASAVISYATSHKLPLSTTYVTFMVAMGTSFADLAWGRESAVYRVTGVLMVIGGWFMTAITAFTISCFFAFILFKTNLYGLVILSILVGISVWRTHHIHKKRDEEHSDEKVFNIGKIEDIHQAFDTICRQVSFLIEEIKLSIDTGLDGLFRQNAYILRNEKQRSKKIQEWANIIVANMFKSMRFVQRQEMKHMSLRYAQTIRRIQKLADGQRDIIQRAHLHVSNHHKGMLEKQVQEINETKVIIDEILEGVITMFRGKKPFEYEAVVEKDNRLRQLSEKLGGEQAHRIQNSKSKTRLSILYYSIIGNEMMISKQNIKLLKIFKHGFSSIEQDSEFDLD